MKSVEEYLYYHENQDYASMKFLSCTYYRAQRRLVVRYLYADEIETQLPILKKRLETLFMQQVGLPLKYDFVYKKVYVDRVTLQLEILNFLRKKFGNLAKDMKEEQVTVDLDHNTWKVNLFLPQSLIDFLHHSKQWQNFQQKLRDKNFYEFEYYFNAIN